MKTIFAILLVLSLSACSTTSTRWVKPDMSNFEQDAADCKFRIRSAILGIPQTQPNQFPGSFGTGYYAGESIGRSFKSASLIRAMAYDCMTAKGYIVQQD